MKTLDEVRNELSELFCSSQTGDDYTSYDLEYYYKSGFDAGVAEMKKRNQVLVDALTRQSPEWETCDHYFEPSKTRNYLMCEKCFAAYPVVKALQQYKESVG